jgi:hypothetical protein
MANISAVIEQLKAEWERVHEEAQRTDAALAALSVTTIGTRPRTMSAAARRRISIAQKALGEEESAEAEAHNLSGGT